MQTKSMNVSIKVILIAIGLGIWVIVLQNAGIIPTKQNEQDVYVRGGSIDAQVKGNVDVNNTIDVNLQKINGKSNVFYDRAGDGQYERIPVYTGN